MLNERTVTLHYIFVNAFPSKKKGNNNLTISIFIRNTNYWCNNPKTISLSSLHQFLLTC